MGIAIFLFDLSLFSRLHRCKNIVSKFKFLFYKAIACCMLNVAKQNTNEANPNCNATLQNATLNTAEQNVRFSDTFVSCNKTHTQRSLHRLFIACEFVFWSANAHILVWFIVIVITWRLMHRNGFFFLLFIC